jgi:hypothetical protein
MSNYRLYLRLSQHLRSIVHTATRSQIDNLALLALGLAKAEGCHLANIAIVLPIQGQRENLVQHVRRILKDTQLCRRQVYGEIVRRVFAHWDAREIGLVMDRTDLKNRLSVLMLGAAYGKRALPLVWEVLDYGGTGAQLQTELLKQAALWIPKGVSVTFFADAEFRAVEVQRLCQQYQWHWQIGVKSDIYFHQPGQEWQQLKEWTIPPGERAYRQNAYLTAKHEFGPINLMADWPTDKENTRYVVMDQPANRLAWRRGRKRQWIENFFRDWKSYGFGLEDSALDDYHRLDGLILGMSVADLWLIYLGQWLIATGQRTLLEPEHKQDYSLFRLGRDYLRRAQAMEWEVPVGFSVMH